MNKRRREEREAELTRELSDSITLPDGLCKEIAAHVVDMEYRKERHGAWVLDGTYTGKKYIRWRCTFCSHWQSAKRHDVTDQIFYMNYCPFCGSQMDKPASDGEAAI